MGGISARPKTPQIHYVVQTVPATATSSASVSEDVASASADIAAEMRSDDLLRRQRGRGGTILTGFTGLNTSVDSAAGRKTLLGE